MNSCGVFSDQNGHGEGNYPALGLRGIKQKMTKNGNFLSITGLNSRLRENYPIHRKGKKLGTTKIKSCKGSFVKYDWELIL